MTCAEVKEYNGELTIFVNDKPIAPMFMLMRRYENKEYIKSLYASGLKVYFIYAETDWMMPGEEDNQGVSLLTIFGTHNITGVESDENCLWCRGILLHMAHPVHSSSKHRLKLAINFQNRLAVCAIDPPPRFFISRM